jgi:hypothetical protein
MGWLMIGLIILFYIWMARDNPIWWFFVGYVFLIVGAISLPPPWSVILKYVVYTIMIIWVVGVLLGNGRNLGGYDRTDTGGDDSG